jgi:hypothetical protein
MTLTVVVDGDSEQVTAQRFRGLVDVAVEIMADAARGTGVELTVAGLHASRPTLVWAPRTQRADIDADEALLDIGQRIRDGVEVLERDEAVPEWMSTGTVRRLYGASGWFGEAGLHGLSFSVEGHAATLTRRTYRTLDRLLHEQGQAIGSVTGVLVTATLNHGSHVTIEEEVHGRGVRCAVIPSALANVAGWIGSRVTVTGVVHRDYRGRPEQVTPARVEPWAETPKVGVEEMVGAFNGPDSVHWLREQRGG